jgi:hypothetical protein
MQIDIYLYLNVHTSIIHKSQRVGSTQVSISTGRDMQNMYGHTVGIFQPRKEWSSDTCYKLNDKRKIILSQVWWPMPVIPTFRRLRRKILSRPAWATQWWKEGRKEGREEEREERKERKENQCEWKHLKMNSISLNWKVFTEEFER